MYLFTTSLDSATLKKQKQIQGTYVFDTYWENFNFRCRKYCSFEVISTYERGKLHNRISHRTKHAQGWELNSQNFPLIFLLKGTAFSAFGLSWNSLGFCFCRACSDIFFRLSEIFLLFPLHVYLVNISFIMEGNHLFTHINLLNFFSFLKKTA